MISEIELLQIKDRLLLAADAAYRIVNTPDPVVRYTEEEYARVHLALSNLHPDISAVLSELDTLRGLFVDRVNEFFKSEGIANEIPISSDAVAGVPDAEGERSGSEARDDAPVPSEPAPAGRTRRRRAKSAKPRGDQAAVQGASQELDPGTASEPVGG